MSSIHNQLKTEYANARIVDYRDLENPNNDIVITCEHAFNHLPDGYSWSESDKLNFANEHWGSDPGAFEMANELAAQLKCVLVHSLYSRLLVDVNRTLVDDSLFRRSGDGLEVELNKDLSYEEEQYRIMTYYMPYYEALREISKKVDPKYLISVHSYTPLYEGKPRSLEVGILYSNESSDLAARAQEVMGTRYRSELNKPYDGNKMTGAVKTLILAKEERKGLTLEFRQDFLFDEEKMAELKAHSVEVVRKACSDVEL